jgi:hypothetical protein
MPQNNEIQKDIIDITLKALQNKNFRYFQDFDRHYHKASIFLGFNNQNVIDDKYLPRSLRTLIDNKKSRLIHVSDKIDLDNEINEYVTILLNSFQKKNEYEGLYDSDYMTHIISDIAADNGENQYLYLFMDVNGLKSVSEFGDGFWSIKSLIKEISEILSKGKTINLLKMLGVKTISFSEGGDEFGTLISCKKGNYSEVKQIFIEGVSSEIASINAEKYIYTDSIKLKDFFCQKGIKHINKNNLKFSVSMGYEVFDNNFLNQNKDIHSIKNSIVRNAHYKSTVNKYFLKQKLKENNLLELYYLYTLRAII